MIRSLLQLQSILDGLERSSPLRLCRLVDVLEDDHPASHVLVLNELDGVVALLVGGSAEVLGKAWKSQVITVEECALKL
jgi:hypothetical protein